MILQLCFMDWKRDLLSVALVLHHNHLRKLYLTVSVLHWSVCVMQGFACSQFNDDGCGITVTKLLSQFVYLCILADNH